MPRRKGEYPSFQREIVAKLERLLSCLGGPVAGFCLLEAERVFRRLGWPRKAVLEPLAVASVVPSRDASTSSVQ